MRRRHYVAVNAISNRVYTFSHFRHVFYLKGHTMARTVYYTTRPTRARGYGLTNFIGDVFMTFLTAGLWLIWVIVREVSR